MNDPHVDVLVYRVEAGQQLAFNHPPALESENEGFRLRLADGQLRVTMKDHFPTETPARLEVDRYLRAWEIATALRYGPDAMRFVFEKAEIIDRNPPPPGTSQVITPCTGGYFIVGGSANVVLGLAEYPGPPVAFVASPVVVEMWSRYKGYRDGREPITTMAYYCLTAIQQIEARNSISGKVLDRLSYLATMVGTAETLRKRMAGQEVRPHTPAEIAWMEAVVNRLVQRAGEWAADATPPWPQITMADFPPL